MKKAIFIILLALPVFLMITISVTGRLIVMYVPTPVESVRFEDDEGEEITELEIGLNQTLVVKATVYPELASNKKVIYTEMNNDKGIFSYNYETNELTATNFGLAKLIAVTDDKKMQTELYIHVSDKYVSGVTLNAETLTLSVGERFDFVASIKPESAENRKISWQSSNTDLVTVDANGRIFCKAATLEDEPVIITVTTDDGGFTKECLVTVSADPIIAFYRIDDDKPLPDNESITVRTLQINLADYLRFNESLFDFEEIEFEIFDAAPGVELNGQHVSFKQRNDYITVIARVTVDGLQRTCSAAFMYL